MAQFTTKYLILGGVMAGFAALANPAQAELQICNETEYTQSVSIGYKGDEDWTSEGWWNIEPGDCATPVQGDLKNRFYYYRAEIDGGDFAGQGYSFCTDPSEYTIVGDTDCEARGYETEDFREIDTGETATEFVFTLVSGQPAETDTQTAGEPSGDGGLEICNRTEDVQSISIGYEGPDGWTSEGWWNIDPDACATPVQGDLQNRYYYFRAEVNGGPFEGEGYYFCTDPAEYTIVGDEDCEARGYASESFSEIDTGPTATQYTYELVAGGSAENTVTTGDGGLEFCNETGHVQSVSIGYEGDDGWMSEGWWNIEPGSCAWPVEGDLQNRYYYYRAEVDGGDFEGEGYTFCTSPDEYTIIGDTDCEARGYDTEDFEEIDTGPTATQFTVSITVGGIVGDGGAEQGGDSGLQFCNETSILQTVAIGYQDDEDWVSEGWWNIGAGDCAIVKPGALQNRYYYYRPEVDGVLVGEGDTYTFCIDPEEFTITGDTDCESRGYVTADFLEVDTGATALEYTVRLTSVPDTTTEADSGGKGGAQSGTLTDTQGDTGDTASSTDTGMDSGSDPVKDPGAGTDVNTTDTRGDLPGDVEEPGTDPEPEPDVTPEPEPEDEPSRGGTRGGTRGGSRGG